MVQELDLDALFHSTLQGIHKRKRDEAAVALQTVTRELRAAKRHKAQPSRATPALSESRSRRQKHMLMLLMILVLAQQRMEVAVAYAMGQGRSPRFQIVGAEAALAHQRENIDKQVYDAFQPASDDHILDMFSDPRYYGNQRRILLATRYVMEFGLYQWLLGQNCDVGVAPVAALMFATALRFIPLGAPDNAQSHLRNMLQDGSAAAHAWLSSFRQRWHAAAGRRLGTTVPFTLSEMQEKARISSGPKVFMKWGYVSHMCEFMGPWYGSPCACGSFLVSVLVLLLGSVLVPGIGGPFSMLLQTFLFPVRNRPPKQGPKSSKKRALNEINSGVGF